MLDSLKKYQKFKKPFYGINTGNRGFLLNKFIHGNLISKILKIFRNFSYFHWKQKIKTQNKVKKIIAINEVSVFRQSKQTTLLEIS